MTKSAEELIDEFVQEVRPPEGIAITLTEQSTKIAEDRNWTLRAVSMPPTAMTRYIHAVYALAHRHPRVDWTRIADHDFGRRRITRCIPYLLDRLRTLPARPLNQSNLSVVP